MIEVNSKRYDLFKDALNTGERIILKYSEDKDDFYSSCIILEFYALIEYFSICVDKTTGNFAPSLIESMMCEIERRSYHYGSRIDKILNFSQNTTFDNKICRKRTADYEQLLQQNFVPCGFWLTTDYPRYDNEIQDTLIRCSVAFGDFSVFFLSNRYPASSLADIDTPILLGINECIFYTNLFLNLSDIVFNYFNASLQLSNAHTSNLYRDLAKPAQTDDYADNKKTLYSILGVSEDASNDTIQKRYDFLKKSKNNTTETIEAINYSYSVLSDSAKRASYDSRLQSDKMNFNIPAEISNSEKTQKRKWSNIIIWVVWIIIYNLITVLLHIDDIHYGGAIGAFIYMTIFFAVGSTLCDLWNKFKK